MDENKIYDEDSATEPETAGETAEPETAEPATAEPDAVSSPEAEAAPEESVTESDAETASVEFDAADGSSEQATSDAQPVLSAETVGKKKLSRGKIKGIIIGAAAVLVAAIVTAVILNSPKIVFASSIKNALQGMIKRDEIAPVVSVLKHGSLAVDGSFNVDEDEAVEVITELKLFFNKKYAYVSDLSVKADDVDIDGSAYFGLDYMYVQSDKLLNGAYGVTAGNGESAFKNSVFADENSEYCLPEEAQSVIANYLRGYDEDIYNDMYKDAEKLLKKYENKIYDLMTKYGEFKSKNTTIKVDGERVKVRQITLIIDQDAALEIMEELYDYVEGDRKLESFFVDYMDFFNEALVATGAVSETFDAQDAYDDFLDSFEEAVEELEDTADDDAEIEIKAATVRGTSRLVRLSVESDNYTMLELEFGKKGARKTDKITYTVNDDTVYVYEVEKDSASEFKATLAYEYEDYYYGETVEKTVLSIDIDKKNDSFKLKLNDNCYVVKGSLKSGLFKTEISIDSISVDGEKNSDFEINITVKTLDFASGMLKKGEYATIDDIKEKDIEEIEENIEELCSSD